MVTRSARRAEASTHGVDLLICLEEQAPLLRGCPDRGGERPAKGGAHSLRSNAWGEARKAHFASPRQIKRKGLPFGSRFLFIWRRGGDCGVHPCTPPLRAARSRASLRLSGSAPAEPSNPVGASHPPAGSAQIVAACACTARTRAMKKAAPWDGFFLYLAERGGFEPPRRYKRLPDFESGTFNRSATSPDVPRRTGDAHHTRKRG
jgi:hypothetical protein